MKKRYVITPDDAIWGALNEYWYVSLGILKHMLSDRDYGVQVFYAPYWIKHSYVKNKYNKLILRND